MNSCTRQEVEGEPTSVVVSGASGDGMSSIQKIAHTFSGVRLVESVSELRLMLLCYFWSLHRDSKRGECCGFVVERYVATHVLEYSQF